MTPRNGQLDPPVHFLLPIYPAFQLLDVAGPLDILNTLSVTHSLTRSITLTFIASTLDPVSTKPVSPLDPATNRPRWTFEGFPQLENGINTQFHQTFNPDVTYESYLAALETDTVSAEGRHKPIDVLLIPGGIGSRIQRVDAATGRSESNIADLLKFIPRVASHIRHSIITVCTGSDVLAQTGLLDGRRATTNMSRFDGVTGRSPAVRWLKGTRWVWSRPTESEVDNGNHAGDNHHSGNRFSRDIWTSAGISAGMDVTLAFVAEHYGGIEVSRTVAQRLEYSWREIGEGEVDPMYGLDPGKI